MKRVDANIILRYLLGDHEDLSTKASDVIDHEEVFVSTEVLCEVVYVLSGVYKVSRQDVALQLSEFIQFSNISTLDLQVILRALSVFSERNIDFVDTILFAYYAERGDEISTFDKQLTNLIKS